MSALPSDMPAAIPSGTITFVFTDIEGSTQRWDRDRAAMEFAVRRHDALMREAIAAHNGHVFKTIGDAFCAAFHKPEDAVAAMFDAQRALGAEDFSAVDGIRVRALCVEDCGDRVLGSREGGAKRVADRLEDVAAMRRDRFAHQRVMATHRDFHG